VKNIELSKMPPVVSGGSYKEVQFEA